MTVSALYFLIVALVLLVAGIVLVAVGSDGLLGLGVALDVFTGTAPRMIGALFHLAALTLAFAALARLAVRRLA
jgi:hypothetical protein